MDSIAASLGLAWAWLLRSFHSEPADRRLLYPCHPSSLTNQILITSFLISHDSIELVFPYFLKLELFYFLLLSNFQIFHYIPLYLRLNDLTPAVTCLPIHSLFLFCTAHSQFSTIFKESSNVFKHSLTYYFWQHQQLIMCFILQITAVFHSPCPILLLLLPSEIFIFYLHHSM